MNSIALEPVALLEGMDTWMPFPARVLAIKDENFNTRTLTMEFCDENTREAYRFIPGQFNMVYVPGVGEAAISISSNPYRPQRLEHTIRLVGTVTRAVSRLKVGDVVGLRGPFGRGWPLAKLEGQDVVVLGGGIGLAPLRPAIYWILQHREHFRRVVLLYGCRTPEDRLYLEELDEWSRDPSLDVLVTVDNATTGWTGPVGVVTNLLRRVKVNAQRTVVIVCGPRILNRVAAWNFLQLHVPPSQVYVSLSAT